MTSPLVYEKVWFDKPKFEAAEKQYYERLAKVVFGPSINGPALISTSISAMQPQPKVFPLMDNKVCCNAEKYTGALNGNENNVQKQSIDLGGIVKTISPAVGDVSAALSDTTVKEEKRSKKEKKIRNKEKKRDFKKQQISNKLGDQDTIETKNNANSVPSVTKPITIPSNTATSPFNKGMDGNLCDKYEGNEITGGLEIMGCPAINTERVKVCDPSEGVQEADVSAKVWPGGKSCILENYSTNVREVDPRKVLKKGSSNSPMKDSLAGEVAKARQHIKQSLECMDDIAAMAGNNSDLTNRINSLEKENADLKKIVEDLKNLALGLESRVKILEGGKSAPVHTPAPAKTSKNEEEDDDGVDLFGSDSEEESEEAARIKEQRLAAYAEKKSKKPALIAKSNIILSVSPWDDETDMKKMEECVRSVKMDGLVWGASKLVPLAYGIHKLHISCVVEDDKVSVDLLQETIQEFEDYVQSVDIAAFNKV